MKSKPENPMYIARLYDYNGDWLHQTAASRDLESLCQQVKFFKIDFEDGVPVNETEVPTKFK